MAPKKATQQMSQQSMPKERRPKATWDPVTTKIFCDICVVEVEAGNRPTTHFSKLGWDNIVKNFNAKTGKEYEWKKFKNKWDSLKSEWILWKRLLGNETGLGWDHNKNTVAASNEWWDTKIKAIPNVAKFREAGLENVVQLGIMFSNIVATGEGAWAPSSGVLPSQGEDETYVTPIEGSGDSEEDVDLTVPLDNIDLTTSQEGSRKRSSAEMPSQDRKGKKVDIKIAKRGKKNKGETARQITEYLGRICDGVESRNSARSSATSAMTSILGCSIGEVMVMLEKIPEVEPCSELHDMATKLFLKPELREMFVALKHPSVQLHWLKRQQAEFHQGSTS